MRVEAFGTVDELNSVIGVLLTEDLPENLHNTLTDIQHDLFDLGGELCVPGRQTLVEENITRLGNPVGRAQRRPAVPEGNSSCPAAALPQALTHVARTVCRRTERRIVSLSRVEDVPQTSVKYINRLSDLLFVMARVFEQACGHARRSRQPGKTQKDN